MGGDHGTGVKEVSPQVIPTRSASSDRDGPLLVSVQPLPGGREDTRAAEKLSAEVAELSEKLGAEVAELTGLVGELRESQKNLTASVAELQAELRSSREEV